MPPLQPYLTRRSSAIEIRFKAFLLWLRTIGRADHQPTLCRPPEPEIDFGCEGCHASLAQGVLWPAPLDTTDPDRMWLVRCNMCDRFATDAEAAEFLLEEGLIDEIRTAAPKGFRTHCFFATPAAQSGRSVKQKYL